MSEITVFINHVGQTLLAEKLEDKAGVLKVKNPAILHVVPNQGGQLQVQLIPYFFREFIDSSSRSEGAVFNFGKDKVVTSDINLDSKLVEQYKRIFSDTPVQTAGASAGGGSPTIKLFDDE